MFGFVLLAIVAVLCSGLVFWFWLLSQIGCEGWRGLVAAAVLQLSLCAFVIAILAGLQAFAILSLVFFPFILLVPGQIEAVSDRFLLHREFIHHIIPVSLPMSLALFCPIILWWRRWRFAPGLAVGLFVSVSLFVSERQSLSLMCQSALAAGDIEIKRNSVFWSLFNVPREFQFEVHAVRGTSSELYAWSYRALDWYAVPTTVLAYVTRDPIRCD